MLEAIDEEDDRLSHSERDSSPCPLQNNLNTTLTTTNVRLSRSNINAVENDDEEYMSREPTPYSSSESSYEPEPELISTPIRNTRATISKSYEVEHQELTTSNNENNDHGEESNLNELSEDILDFSGDLLNENELTIDENSAIKNCKSEIIKVFQRFSTQRLNQKTLFAHTFGEWRGEAGRIRTNEANSWTFAMHVEKDNVMFRDMVKPIPGKGYKTRPGFEGGYQKVLGPHYQINKSKYEADFARLQSESPGKVIIKSKEKYQKNQCSKLKSLVCSKIILWLNI